MKGERNIYHHSHTSSFLLVFVVLITFHPAFSINVNTMSPTESLTISGNRTIVSPGDDFELGFFKPGTSSSWYLGIWYKKVPEKTYAWVANRDNPLSNSIGTLKISDNNLVIVDENDKPVWSTNLTRGDVSSPVVAELLANGNLVMRYSNNNDPNGFLWQSFDFPTDTLLPGMKLGLDRKTGINRFLTSWKGLDDPSSGNYSYKLEIRGFPEFFLRQKQIRIHRSGPWDGTRFNGIPEERQSNYIVYNFTENSEEVVYTFLMNKHSIYSRLTLSNTGYFQRFTWIQPAYGWTLFWSSPRDTQCDLYQMCGPYAYCDMNTSPECNCMRGFDPVNKQGWELRDGSGGCSRTTPLNCKGDGFVRLKQMKLPDTTMAFVDRKIGVKECKERCLQNCNCTAFAKADIRKGGLGCVIWTGELADIRNYVSEGQDLFVRAAAADLVRKRNISKKVVGLIIGVSIVLLISTMLYFWKRGKIRATTIAAPVVSRERNQDLLMNRVVITSGRRLSEENITEDLELPLIEFKAVVMATDNFSDCNKLGQGGFGIVYKGRLLDGEEIAVKRLSEMSHQGTHEFKNEVKLIARLQHINLVQILGCCVDAKEKMLIYEYLENSSLDRYLFDHNQSFKLGWQKRFDITNGIARGLLYLHQDSRCRIIHRDLKASNVLLDKDMTPKISDFGMARIFARDEKTAITRRIVGTHGYMAPEYAMDGIFSVKSDVFSFGVLLLEIVSGKRNRGFYNSNQEDNLLRYTWRNWKDGKGLEIVDPYMEDSSSSLSTYRPDDALRCIQIGLLCVQELAEDRPLMSSVVLMLGSETTGIPQPKPPGYCIGRSAYETDSPLSKQRDDISWTVNEIAPSVIDAR